MANTHYKRLIIGPSLYTVGYIGYINIIPIYQHCDRNDSRLNGYGIDKDNNFVIDNIIFRVFCFSFQNITMGFNILGDKN